MFVLCPHCQFLAALDPASGQPPAHCPRCHELLQAAAIETVAAEPATMQGDAAAAADADVAVTEDDVAAIAADMQPEVDVVPDAPLDSVAEEIAAPAQPAPVTEVATAIPTQRASRSVAKATPSFARRPMPGITRDPRRRWRVALTVAGLTLLLVLQLLLADRAELARDARWRPALSSLCGVLRCSLPPWREASAFTLLSRDVRAGQPGVLHVTASFRNDARWPQPWPALLLNLSDVDGRVVGARAFTPRQYLGAVPAQNLVASGQSATIAFDILEPTPRIVAFAFDFR